MCSGELGWRPQDKGGLRDLSKEGDLLILQFLLSRGDFMHIRVHFPKLGGHGSGEVSKDALS